MFLNLVFLFILLVLDEIYFTNLSADFMLTPLLAYDRFNFFMNYLFRFFKAYITKISIIFIFFFNILIFFSTENALSRTYLIKNIDIIEPYDLNFKKDKVVDSAFKEAFKIIISKVLMSENLKKVNNYDLDAIRTMIKSFSITNEEFIDNKYHAKFDVFFEKKKLINYFYNLNIITSTPIEKNVFFLPILVNLNNNEIKLFNENKFYVEWEKIQDKSHLIKYILPDEDLDDYNYIKQNFQDIESYDFKEILNKYDNENYIVSVFLIDNNNLDILSKVSFNKNISINKFKFENIDYKTQKNFNKIILDIKKTYEDKWKEENQINLSIKLPLKISIKSKNINLIKKFEDDLKASDLIYNYNIESMSKNKTLFKIIYNGNPDKLIKNLKSKNYNLDFSGETWTIK